jgi:hypothetical protein
LVLPEWSEKQTSDREMPELMEQGLMGWFSMVALVAYRYC